MLGSALRRTASILEGDELELARRKLRSCVADSGLDVEQQAAALGIDEHAAQEKFGFLLSGLRFGAPPHGGIALGMDRIVMLLAERGGIRDVIAYPKTQKGTDLMSEAPGPVSPEQLAELRIRTVAE